MEYEVLFKSSPHQRYGTIGEAQAAAESEAAGRGTAFRPAIRPVSKAIR